MYSLPENCLNHFHRIIYQRKYLSRHLLLYDRQIAHTPKLQISVLSINSIDYIVSVKCRILIGFVHVLRYFTKLKHANTHLTLGH